MARVAAARTVINLLQRLPTLDCVTFDAAAVRRAVFAMTEHMRPSRTCEVGCVAEVSRLRLLALCLLSVGDCAMLVASGLAPALRTETLCERAARATCENALAYVHLVCNLAREPTTPVETLAAHFARLPRLLDERGGDRRVSSRRPTTRRDIFAILSSKVRLVETRVEALSRVYDMESVCDLESHRTRVSLLELSKVRILGWKSVCLSLGRRSPPRPPAAAIARPSDQRLFSPESRLEEERLYMHTLMTRVFSRGLGLCVAARRSSCWGPGASSF